MMGACPALGMDGQGTGQEYSWQESRDKAQAEILEEEWGRRGGARNGQQ